jgi:hypothetical protein
LRAAINARAADILTCAARERVAVSATYDAAGVVSISLQGELAGSAAEGCVRQALSELEVSSGATSGQVLQLVRSH